jgi:hypothetical protein
VLLEVISMLTAEAGKAACDGVHTCLSQMVCQVLQQASICKCVHKLRCSNESH